MNKAFRILGFAAGLTSTIWMAYRLIVNDYSTLIYESIISIRAVEVVIAIISSIILVFMINEEIKDGRI